MAPLLPKRSGPTTRAVLLGAQHACSTSSPAANHRSRQSRSPSSGFLSAPSVCTHTPAVDSPRTAGAVWGNGLPRKQGLKRTCLAQQRH